MKAIFVLIVLGALFAIVTDADNLYPFSNYPMYSLTFEPGETLMASRVEAEDVDGNIWTIPRAFELYPFWGASFREALWAEYDLEAVKKKIQVTYTWLQQRRVRWGLPPLKKLSLYKVELPWAQFRDKRMRREPVSDLIREHFSLIWAVDDSSIKTPEEEL